jgi:hypothetical protein
MRFRHLFLLPPLALAAFATSFGGCNQEQEVDNLCLFLKDQDSCYQEFLTTIGTQCTMESTDPNYAGDFSSPYTLDSCAFSGATPPAGVVTQVTFDPPIEMAKLSAYTGGIATLSIDGTQCGIIEFDESDKVSVALDVYPILSDPDAPCETSGVQFCGSSFSNKPLSGDDAPTASTTLMKTTCPDGTSFTFDRRQVEQQCVDQAGLLPKAKLVVMPNGVEKPGMLTLSIKYSPDITRTYVKCNIPAQPPPCANGIKDGLETDVDCGGGSCVAKCPTGSSCLNDSDCATTKCVVVSGIKKCQP